MRADGDRFMLKTEKRTYMPHTQEPTRQDNGRVNLRRLTALDWQKSILAAGGLTLVLGIIAGSIGFPVHALKGLLTFIQLTTLFALLQAGMHFLRHAPILVGILLAIDVFGKALLKWML